MSSTNRGGQRIEADRYYTPDTLAAACVATLPSLRGGFMLEPHGGGGAFVRAMLAAGATVLAFDIDPNAPGRSSTPAAHWKTTDFLTTPFRTPIAERPRWIVGNPPYNDAEAHTRHALTGATEGVAFLLRLAFLESVRRLPFWQAHRPSAVYVIVPRPSFTADGKSDSAAYGWFVWHIDSVLTPTPGSLRQHPDLRWLSWSKNV